MLRDITLGQYYPADSILHRLDPRVKFVGTIVYVVSLFLFHNWGYLLGTVFLAVMIKLSKVPFKFITKGLKSIFVLLAITMVFNILSRRVRCSSVSGKLRSPTRVWLWHAVCRCV